MTAGSEDLISRVKVRVPARAMSQDKKDESRGKDRLFDGSAPEGYWRWKRWALGQCYAELADKPKAWGPKINRHCGARLPCQWDKSWISGNIIFPLSKGKEKYYFLSTTSKAIIRPSFLGATRK